MAEHRLHRLQGFIQSGQRPATDSRQRVRQPQRLDHRGRGCLLPLAAQDACGLGEPCRDGIVRVFPKMPVPAGRAHTRSVSAGKCEPLIRPRDPRRGDLVFLQPFEERIVLADLGSSVERGRMPRSADHGDVLETILLRRAHAFPHPCLAQKGLAGFLHRQLTAQLGDRLQDRFEKIPVVAALLHAVVPPSLAIAVAVGLGKPLEGIRARRAFVIRFPQREHVRGRQIEAADWHLVPHRPAHRIPFRGKLRERIERRFLRQVGAIQHNRHRRLHRPVRRMLQQRLQLHRHLDQHDIRCQRIQRRQQAARAARAVVTYAEDRGHGFFTSVSRSAMVSE